jgi:hypothetical protein
VEKKEIIKKSREKERKMSILLLAINSSPLWYINEVGKRLGRE